MNPTEKEEVRMRKFYMLSREEQPIDNVLLSSGYPSDAPVSMSREEALMKYQAGEMKGPLRFVADVYGTGKNKNHTTLNEEELPKFAKSFVGQPFLKDHKHEQDARGGTIRKSELVEVGKRQMIRQTIEVVKDWAIEGYLDGTIDRFSIGWDAEQYLCTICGTDFFDEEEKHSPFQIGTKDAKTGKTIGVLMKGLEGDETSVVTHPAVDGTGVREQLARYMETRIERTPTASVEPSGVEGTNEDDEEEEAEIVSKKVEAVITEPSSGRAPEPNKEVGMLQELVSLLSMPPETTEAEALAETKKRLATDQVPEAMLAALDLKPGASIDQAVMKAVEFKAPGSYVPVSQYRELEKRVASIQADDLVRQGMAAGKITPATEKWAREFAGRDFKSFASWVKEVEPQIPPPVNVEVLLSDTKKTPTPSTTLSEEEEMVRRSGTLTVDQFIAARQASKGGVN